MTTSELKRWQQDSLTDALETFRVVLLVGARQCGKSTLARSISMSPNNYRTLDDKSVRDSALADPVGFVSSIASNTTQVIDEIQKAPELLSAIKVVVDQNLAKGQFLLTGSAEIQSLPTVRESLAGRAGRVQLRPLTQGEINGVKKSPQFLERIFNNSISPSYPATSRDTLVNAMFQGGFPETLHLSTARIKAWHKEYISALIQRDLKDISNILRTDALASLINVLTAWTSKYLDISSICTQLEITRTTVHNYIAALEAMFIVETLPAWKKSDYARIAKHDKRFMIDTGLVASLLSWNRKDFWLKQDSLGKLVETLIFHEISTQIDCSDEDYNLYHYRDREQREIDFIIENSENDLVGIEVKAGATVGAKDFTHLKWFRDKIAQGTFKGIVLYTGSHTLSFGDNLWAVPMSSLWTI
jgi:uncharacterized protein